MKIGLAADLHFGRVPEGVCFELRGAIQRLKPDAIVIAGDLTPGARQAELEQAGLWLQSLSPKLLVLPGNGDLPYGRLPQRLTDPLGRFRRATGSGTLVQGTADKPHVPIRRMRSTTLMEYISIQAVAAQPMRLPLPPRGPDPAPITQWSALVFPSALSLPQSIAAQRASFKPQS